MTSPSHASTATGLVRFVARRATIMERPPAHAERLAAFLAAAGPMLARVARTRAPSIANPIGFAKAMRAIAGPLGLARDAGVLADPWVLARLKRREVANAAVLAGLWSPASNGKLATEFLMAFFERLRSRPGGDVLPARAALSGGYLVRTEDRPVGDAADRVDITIEGRDFLVGIEVKIDAGLQPDQLARYKIAIDRRAANRKRAAVIFLSPRRNFQSGVIQAGWGDVVAAAYAVSSKYRAMRTVNHHLIERFAAHVAQF